MSEDNDKLSRRKFLKIGLLLSSASLIPGCMKKEPESKVFERIELTYDPLKEYPYRGWEKLYEEQFTWDRIVRSTHSANCTGSCSWQVFVKDGVMLREEQASDYPRISEEIPDYNPRGCQKGACFVEYVYGPQRLKYPLIRQGKRGEGKWKRATWDEALSLIAEKIIDNIYNYGPDTNTFFSVIPAMSAVSFAAGARLAHYIGGVVCSFYDWYCDLPPGEPITWGVQTESCECADWYNSNYIVLWGANILQTRIPDAHFAMEARYRGAKIAAISPDYNSSCIHADLYLGIKPGTDALLALGVAKILIDEELCDLPYIREQTDMSFLVVKESGRFLRESDLKEKGKESQFYLWDEGAGAPVPAPGCEGSSEKSIDLASVRPALSGTFKVKGANGEIEVLPVFQLLRDSLGDYTLDFVARMTEIPGKDIQAFARDFGKRKPAMIIHGAGTNHWFHNDLNNRTMILLTALTGNVGKNGGGFNHYVGQERLWPERGFKKLAYPEGPRKQRFQNMTLWSYVHSRHHDDILYGGKPIASYILESVRNGWMPLYPVNDWDKISDIEKITRHPRSLIVWRANYLNQAKGSERILNTLWQELDLVVNINYRMDTTALYSDVVLPAASYYEKTDINTTDCHSFIHPFGKALDPLYESKTDWDIFAALALKIQEISRKKSLPAFDDKALEWKRKLADLYEDWSAKGDISTDVAAADFILSHSEETKGMTYDSLKTGPKRFVATDPEVWTSDIEPGIAYTPFKHQIEKKKPWRTLTGRQQFYIDHPWYIELGEALPIFKEPLSEKGVLHWNTPHGRWSIHSTWRDARAMLRLQRGVPLAYIHPDEATARGIRDGDWVRIFNRYGDLVCLVMVTPAERKGRVTMYHGWEKYLGFKEGGWQSLTCIRINPLQLAGGYGQLKFRLNYWGPTGNNRDILVDIQKA